MGTNHETKQPFLAVLKATLLMALSYNDFD